MNPITQRSTTSGQQNGVGPQAKNNTHKAAINAEANMEKLAHERLIHLLANFMVSERDGTGHFQSLIDLMVVGPHCYCDIEEWRAVLRDLFRGIHGKQ